MVKEKEKFKLIKFLGAGGFAQVHVAEVLDPKDRKKWGNQVVLKIPHDKAKEHVLVKELMMNASLSLVLQQARSGYVVPFLDCGFFDNLYVMIMKYVEGESLRNYLNEKGEGNPIEVEEALDIVENICQGLKEIHACRVYHRDIKPENILLTKDHKKAMIMDLGISKLISSAHRATSSAGTIPYMPKELLDKDGGSFYSDIYSLGVTMYEMMTGELPFKGDSLVELITNIQASQPISPMDLNPEIDRGLNHIIMKALNKSLEGGNCRYLTAEEFLNDLKAYRDGGNSEDYYIDQALFRSQELIIQNKIKEAEEDLKNLVQQFPVSPRSHLALGEFYNRCQRNQSAIRVFRKALEQWPDYPLFYRDMALSLAAVNLKSEAVSHMKTAID
ncbi:MAG: protein kinase, partial [Candidatus Omnitrophica bacterium]|nr:protein kinase [Candidatus Omnitrophota bacterium]